MTQATIAVPRTEIAVFCRRHHIRKLALLARCCVMTFDLRAILMSWWSLSPGRARSDSAGWHGISAL